MPGELVDYLERVDSRSSGVFFVVLQRLSPSCQVLQKELVAESHVKAKGRERTFGIQDFTQGVKDEKGTFSRRHELKSGVKPGVSHHASSNQTCAQYSQLFNLFLIRPSPHFLPITLPLLPLLSPRFSRSERRDATSPSRVRRKEFQAHQS